MPAAFDRSAWFYDSLARLIFGGVIRRSQIHLLPFIPPQASVLIVGGGTGWLLQDLAALRIPLQVTYLELSPRMLAKAQKVAARLSDQFLQVSFRQGTEAILPPQDYFEVIFTPFVLDLYPDEQLLPMVKKLHQHLKPSGLWLLTDFFISPETTIWQKWWQSRLARTMYLFFNWLDGLTTRKLPVIAFPFQQLALPLQHTRSFYGGFIRAQVYSNSNALNQLS